MVKYRLETMLALAEQLIAEAQPPVPGSSSHTPDKGSKEGGV
jgi:hypothetical protein